MSGLDLTAIAPELAMLVGACAFLLLGAWGMPSRWLIPAAVAWFLVVATIIVLSWPEASAAAFSNQIVFGPLTATLKFAVVLASAAALAYSGEYLHARQLRSTEYVALAMFATCGMMLLLAAASFLTVYLGLELMSLSMYAMIALRRDDNSAIESSMKYFVLGAIASGLLLYGISMIYAATGQLEIAAVAQALGDDGKSSGLLALGLVFMMAGVAFKLGAAPFHMWLPDVYEGAPTAVTLFISGAPKIAAFAMAIRVIVEASAPLSADWQQMFALLAIASLMIGNVAAIAQRSLKRMLAYSAISHMGFMLIGLVAATPEGYAAAMFYVLAYVLMTLGGFGMLVLLSQGGVEVNDLDDIKGMAKRNGVVAGLVLVLMLSMAGIPPLVGFYAKLVVWAAAVEAGWTSLVVISAVFSVVGAFYYLRVVKLMYFDAPVKNAPSVRLAGGYLRLALLNGVLIIYFGILPGSIMDACMRAFSS